MEFISRDTNVWIDFEVISRLGLPFRLPYTYIMYTESIDSELLMPPGIKEKLTAAGLVGVDITTQEFLIADEWGKVYPRLSGPDRIALAIAKERKIVLLTGDMALRKAAEDEQVGKALGCCSRTWAARRAKPSGLTVSEFWKAARLLEDLHKGGLYK